MRQRTEAPQVWVYPARLAFERQQRFEFRLGPREISPQDLPLPLALHIPLSTSQKISMNPSNNTAPNTARVDGDLVEQAHPGRGVPSHDPASAAQFLLEPEKAEREADSVLMGGGMVAGVATGATVGALVAGPVGVVVDGTAGAVVGALGAAIPGTAMNPDDSSSAGAAPSDTAHLHSKDIAGGGRTNEPVDKSIT